MNAQGALAAALAMLMASCTSSRDKCGAPPAKHALIDAAAVVIDGGHDAAALVDSASVEASIDPVEASDATVPDADGEPAPPLPEGACQRAELIYANGARWREACHFWKCTDGVATTTDNACRGCTLDSECGEDFVCKPVGLACGRGTCEWALPRPDPCDAPTNVDAVCGCDGMTYDSPCDALRGIAHYGACATE